MRVSISNIKISIVFSLILTLVTGCAYQLGTSNRGVPGGFRTVAIPVFKNRSQEVGVEVPFTNALKLEFERTHSARVVDERDSEVIVEGAIDSIDYRPIASQTSAGLPTLPAGAVLATSYLIDVTSTMTLRQKSNGKVLWTGQVKQQKTYTAPQVATSVVNSVNPLYNLSSRRANLDVMATDMMTEAHDRMTENF